MANRWAPSILARAFSGGTADAIDFSSNTLKLALMANSYTPAADLTGVATYANVSASEAAGTGYVAGGITVPTPAMGTVFANSYAGVWAAGAAYTVGQVVRPSVANGHLYVAIVGGTAGGTAPTWPVNPSQDVADGGVTWSEIGTSLTKFSTGNIVSPSMSLTGIQYGWIYVSAGITNQDLICLLDFGSAKTWTSTVVTFTPDANLGWTYLTPV